MMIPAQVPSNPVTIQQQVIPAIPPKAMPAAAAAAAPASQPLPAGLSPANVPMPPPTLPVPDPAVLAGILPVPPTAENVTMSPGASALNGTGDPNQYHPPPPVAASLTPQQIQ